MYLFNTKGKYEKNITLKNKLIFTETGFCVKSVSRETIKKNFQILKQIAKEAEEYKRKNNGKISKQNIS